MKITFREVPNFVNSHINHDIDYSTIIPISNYTLAIQHVFTGSGMSDRYKKESYLEVYRGEENVTKNILRNEFDEFPIEATSENLSLIMDTLHAKL